MISLDILCVGRLERDEDGTILEADSTSVLIRAEGRLIVVDPSTEYMRAAIKTSFKQIGVFPKDVDTVVLTHSHDDHTGNLDLFKKAKVIMHSGGENEVPRAELFDGDEMQLCPGVRLVHTPGHCPDEISVFVDADRHYAIAGDTVPLEDNLKKNIPPRINTDRDQALESIKKIREYADVVVPGHGFPFMTR
jgi:glyoxylase-like metal-dependent hydrolase (beta-lactamase superfamily II)